MENFPVSKYTVSFGLSLAFCSVVNALLVVAKEKSPAVAAHLQKITGHHWVTHAAFIVLLFFLGGGLLGLANLKFSAGRLLGVVTAGVLAGGLIIMGFYLIAD
jgi:hypothetical protein